VAALVLSFALDLAEKYLQTFMSMRNAFIKGLAVGGLLVFALVLKSSTTIPFIYFRF
jgi:hypothetical protein